MEAAKLPTQACGHRAEGCFCFRRASLTWRSAALLAYKWQKCGFGCQSKVPTVPFSSLELLSEASVTFFSDSLASLRLPYISWAYLSPVCKLGANTLSLNIGLTCIWQVLWADGLRWCYGAWLCLTSRRSRSGPFSNLETVRSIKINLQEILCVSLLIQKTVLASR